MKPESIAIVLLLSLLSINLSGQYIPIVKEGKYWIYQNCFDEDHPVPVSGHAITFQENSRRERWDYDSPQRRWRARTLTQTLEGG